MRLEVTDTRTLTDENPVVREMEFRKPPVSVGSHSENLVQLPDIDIAPKYATLDIVNDNWVFRPSVRDGLAKQDGRPITEPVELKDGDVIVITYFSLKFIIDPEVESDELALVSATGELAKIRQFPVPSRTEIRKADADLSLNAARQNTLSQYIFSLRQCNDLPTLLESILRFLRSEFAARLAWIGVRRNPTGSLEFMDGLSEAGPHHANPPKFETFEYRCLDRHQFLSIPRTGDEDTQSVLAIPLMASRGAIGLLYIDSRKHTRVYDGADLGFLTALARFLTPLFEAVFDQKPPGKSSGAGGELGLIRQMQATLDPRNVPEWSGLQIASFSKSGTGNPGDLYDIMRLPNGLAAVLVGRVTADLVRTATALPQIQGAFRLAGLHADPPKTQLKALNWILHSETNPCRLDVAILLANPKTGVAEISTAGAIGALHISVSGQARKLVVPNAPAVGASKSFDYTATAIRMKTGDTLAIYTPGWTRARNEAGTVLSEEKFTEAVCDGFNHPAVSAIEELVADLSPYIKKGTLSDDITLLLLYRAE
jgi:hypothetical protein